MSKAKRLRAQRAQQKQAVRNELNRPDVQKVMYAEINKQLATATERFQYDTVTCIMLCLHEVFGFGKVRLRRFYDEYSARANELRDWYAVSDSDMPWLARMKLKEIGVDLDAWEKENEEKSKDFPKSMEG